MVESSPVSPSLTGSQLTRALIIWCAVLVPIIILSILTLPMYIQSVINFGQGGPFAAEMGPDSFPLDTTLLLANHFIYVVAILILGILIFIRLPRHRIALLTSAAFIILALTNSVPLLLAGQVNLPTKLLALVASISPLALIFVYLVFPTGRLVHLRLAVLLLCGTAIGTMLLGPLANWAMLAVWFATLGLVIFHYRETPDPLMRQQLKWAIIGLGGIIIGLIIHIFTMPIQNFLLSLGTGTTWFEVSTRGFELVLHLLNLAGPLGLTIALLRVPYKHSENLVAE